MSAASKSPLLRVVLRVLRSALVIYVAVVVLIYVFQRRLQYFPSTESVPLPKGEGYEGLEEVQITTEDGVALECWYWPGERPITVLLFHGNAGHRGHRLGWIEGLRRSGVGICIPDYRGYGGSEGSPTEEGLYRDAEAVLEWLRRRSPGQLVYFGESLGTGVAVELATRHPPDAMILQSSFSSIVDVARTAYWYLPVSWLLKDRYESDRKITTVSCPLLVIHGERDRIIPSRLGRALFDAASEPKEWHPVSIAGHNDVPWLGGQDYFRRIDEFLGRHLGSG